MRATKDGRKINRRGRRSANRDRGGEKEKAEGETQSRERERERERDGRTTKFHFVKLVPSWKRFSIPRPGESCLGDVLR